MPWINYHSHTNFCDGKTHAEELILAAIKEKFPAYFIVAFPMVPYGILIL